MKIEISIGEEHMIPVHDGEEVWWVEDEDIVYEHEGYFESIDEAIKHLQYLKMCEERGDFIE